MAMTGINTEMWNGSGKSLRTGLRIIMSTNALDDPVTRILDKLQNVRQLTTGGHTARCPAHEDKNNSLKIDVGDEGQALVHCHAGCTADAIVAALNLTLADLFPPKAQATITRNGRGRHIAATYDYRDETGTLLYQAVRFEPKDFLQRRPDGRGGWRWSLGDVRRVPYRLSEILAADSTAWILIVEGEKDADRLAELGFVATTNAGGAGKWRPEYAEHFCGRRVCIIPDNDAAGEKHETTVAQSLIGIAADVRTLRLPNLPAKGDVSDWLDAGGTAAELAKLIIFAPRWNESAKTDDDPLDDESPPDAPRSRSHAEILALDLPPSRPLVAGLIEEGSGCILAGPGGTGKTWLSIDLARCVAAGLPWLGHFATNQTSVLIIDEEGNERGIQDRLRLLNAAQPLEDPPLWFAIGHGLKIDADATRLIIEEEISRYQPGLVIFDSLTRVHSANENDASEMSRVFARFAGLRREYGCAVMLIDHLRKKGLINDEAEMLRGSTDKRNWPDTILFASPVDGGGLTVSHIKARYGEPVPDFTVALEIDNDAGTGRVRYQGAAPSKNVAKGNDILEAIHALKRQLGEDGASVMTIAAWLDVSEATVRRHIKKLLSASIVRMRRVATDGRPRDVYDVLGGTE